MKILKLCYEFPPLGGGAARVVLGLSRELVKQGHEVKVVTMGMRGLPDRELVDGVEVCRVPGIRRQPYHCSIAEAACHLPFAASTALRLIREQRFDIIHTHFILPDGLNALWIGRRTKLPFVITAHGSDVPGYDPHRLRVAHKLLAPIWRSIVGSADAIVSPSDVLGQLIRDRVPDIQVDIIPNGLDVSQMDPHYPRKKRILVVSKVLERKGIQYLVHAVAGADLDHEVHIVGDGPYLPELQRLIADTGAPVRLWGWLDNDSEELQHLFKTSSIFALPSESENFPIVLLEAMRAGLAIVTTRGTGCAEVVGDTAILVKPRNIESIRSALTRLTSDPELCRLLGNAARARIESKFSWTAVANRYLELYESCLHSNPTLDRASVQLGSALMHKRETSR